MDTEREQVGGGEKKQVDRSAYSFDRYCGLDRWSSYHYQITEILRSLPVDNSGQGNGEARIGRARPHAVLEIGVGDGVVAHYLKSNTDIAYTSLDIADDVGADVIGSVTALPFHDKSFDVVCAFE